MDALSSNEPLAALHRADDTGDATPNIDADNPISMGLSSLPQELQYEILDACSAHDITNLHVVSVSLHASLQRHPMMRVFNSLRTPSYCSELITGLKAIQTVPLPFRAALMRDYAFRMVCLRDDDGSMPWRFYLRLCEKQLPQEDDDPIRCLGLRDLCIAKPIALLRVVMRPSQRQYLIYECEEKLEALPLPYRADVLGVLMGLKPDTISYDRQVSTLIESGERLHERAPMRLIAVMAALQLFESGAEHICHRLTRRFGLSSQQRIAMLEPLFVAALALRFPRRGGDLTHILKRWSLHQRSLRPALHQALLLQATEAARTPLIDVFDFAMTKIAPTGHVRATEDVLAIPSSATRDHQVVLSVMSTFWTFYWSNHRISSLRSCRRAWMTVLQMPWQVQPTLLARLVCRTGSARLDVDDWWGEGESLARWEQKTVAICLAHDRPRLAVRALTLAFQLSRLQDHATQSAVLQRALTVACNNTPPWSWNELMEALCLHRAEAYANPGAKWPEAADVQQWLTTFLADAATWMIGPSPTFVGALSSHIEFAWHALPDEGNGGDARFERLCDRLDLMQLDRRIIKASLLHRLAPEARERF